MLTSMSLAPGVRLGPYEILALVGLGGMGEVYRARDVRLKRIVALKLLNTDRAAVPLDRARLEREARAIGSLEHPRICVLHDFSEYDGRSFLVMEHIEGETLAERLVRGRLPTDEALEYAMQVLEALDHAHHRGIVHADLKPSNVMLTASGIKLLDFGLAALRPLPVSIDESSLDPTKSVRGHLQGTLPYMAPEQIETGITDERTDIFAFGATLFEMVTGCRAFEGSTPAGTIASILERQPTWTAKNLKLPHGLESLVNTCLAKNPERRWQNARDVELQLRAVLHPTAAAEPVKGGRYGIPLMVAAALLTLAAAVAARTLWPPVIPAGPRTQFVVEPPAQSAFASAWLSPDGRQLAFFRLHAAERTTELWTRTLDSLETRQLEGTRGAKWQFWSPDSQAVAFFAGGRLKIARPLGGPIDDVAPAPAPFGGSWGRDGSIVYAPAAQGGLYGVDARGGQATQLTDPSTASGEISHRWPHFLPDGRHFLFLSWHADPTRRALFVGSLDGEAPRRVGAFESAAVFAPPGYLLWTTRGTLLARRFNPDTLAFSGDVEVVASHVLDSPNFGWSAVSAAANGALLYHTIAPSVSQPTWFSRAGLRLHAVAEEGSYGDLSLAADQNRLALTLAKPDGPEGIWQIDLARGILSKTAAETRSTAPIWSPDGNWIVFAKNDRGAFRLFRKASGGGAEELLPGIDKGYVPIGGKQVPSDWSSDGRDVLFEEGGDIWTIGVTDPAKPRTLVAGPAHESEARLSPDRRWVAFSSDSTARREVYIASATQPEQRWQISSQGGHDPAWRKDGRELFYVAADMTLMAVALDTHRGMVRPAAPSPLFQLHTDPLASRTFAATSDGQRFVVNQLVQAPTPQVTVVLNWTSK